MAFKAATAFFILSVSGNLWAQTPPQMGTVEVNGKTGEASLIRSGGNTYVEVGALTQIANGSLSFRGNRIVLSFPGAPAGAAAQEPAPSPAPQDPDALSRNFMKAAIEELALMREWGSNVANVINNGYPVSDGWVNGYRDPAAQGLQLAQVAASTDGDHKAQQLLSNEFQSLQAWSNKLVQARANMDATNYAMSPDALRNDPSSQKLIACGHFLATMLGSGTFQDGPCH
jgi:hypothetical protein